MSNTFFFQKKIKSCYAISVFWKYQADFKFVQRAYEKNLENLGKCSHKKFILTSIKNYFIFNKFFIIPILYLLDCEV